MIVAMAENGVIGRNNSLPWHLPDDLKRFKAITTGHPIVMGRKTFESIGRLLPKRTNVILTRRPDFVVEGAVVLREPEEVQERFKNEDEVFIIGGAEIYGCFIDLADRLYLTKVHHAVQGDVSFPEFNENAFREISKERVEEPIPHTFSILDRI